LKLIDLTLPIVTGMSVYPGDPPVCVREIRDLRIHGFRLSEIQISSHTGTHVNAPWHMAAKGVKLEDLPLTHFVAKAMVRQRGRLALEPDMGLIYADFPLDESELPLILAARPPFVAQAVEYPLDAAIERALCEAGIVSFENLTDTAKLPRSRNFLFAGLPLAITGDGAPVRAIAIL